MGSHEMCHRIPFPVIILFASYSVPVLSQAEHGHLRCLRGDLASNQLFKRRQPGRLAPDTHPAHGPLR